GRRRVTRNADRRAIEVDHEGACQVGGHRVPSETDDHRAVGRDAREALDLERWIGKDAALAEELDDVPASARVRPYEACGVERIARERAVAHGHLAIRGDARDFVDPPGLGARNQGQRLSRPGATATMPERGPAVVPERVRREAAEDVARAVARADFATRPVGRKNLKHAIQPDARPTVAILRILVPTYDDR